MSRIIIVGGGLAGGLAALALARRRPELDLLLVEQGSAFGGNHTWSFFDTDIDTTSRWVLDPIERIHWPDHAIRFPRRSRTIPIGYNSIRSAGFDAAIKAALKPEQYRLGEAIDVLGPTDIKLSRGERIEADSVIDARGPGAVPGLDLGWQKFVGRVYRFSRPHGVPRPVIMDGTVTQHDGYRFLYFLPLSGTDLLIEDTYYSTDPSLDRATLCGRLGESAAVIDASEASILDEESGVLPVVMGGDFETLWPGHDPIPRLGLRGGFFHPTTSYSLPDAVGNAAWLAAQSDLSVGALAAGLRVILCVGESLDVREQGRAVDVVDPGMARRQTDITDPIRALGLSPSEVTDVILGHHHPDHTLNAGLFPQARVHDHWAIYEGWDWTDQDAEGYELTPAVRLIRTPGHTAEDISTAVGTAEGVAVCTHLWLHEGSGTTDDDEDPTQLAASRERVLAIADLIVPGHGPPFRPPPRR